MSNLNPQQTDPIGRAALLWLRVQELENRPVPTLRALSQVVDAAADATRVHRAVVNLRHAGLVEFTRIYTGRRIKVAMTASGRKIGDAEIARTGQRIDPITTRPCMTCRRKFEAEWSGHRICERCKATDAYRSYDLAPLHV